MLADRCGGESVMLYLGFFLMGTAMGALLSWVLCASRIREMKQFVVDEIERQSKNALGEQGRKSA